MEPWNGEQRSLVEQWLAALDDSDWNTRATAARMLGELGELTPLAPLLAVLNDEDESVRAATVRALGKLGERAPVDRLVIALSDPSWMVREMAALTLGELGERVPTEPLADILHAAHEDTFVREAAQLALQQAHPEIESSLAQDTAITPQPHEQSPATTVQHHSLRSSQASLLGLAKRFLPLHTAMQETNDLVEISDLAPAANSNLPLPPPVSVSSRRSLPLRIAEGALVALLLLSIGVSWLLLAHKLHPSPSGSTSRVGSTPTPTPISSPPFTGHNIGLTIVDGVVYVGTADKVVYALQASDGSLLWRFNTNGSIDESPLVVNGVVYVSANVVAQGPGYLAGSVYALRASDGGLLWHYIRSDYVFRPTVVDGVAYVSSQDGTLSALRSNDGTLLWRHTAKGAGGISPLLVNGIVYVVSTDINQGPYYVYALRASDGAVLWHHASYDYAPVIVNGVAYVTSPDGLVALQATDGTLLWSYALSNTFFPPPIVLNGIVYTIGLKVSLAAAAAHTGGYLLRTSIETVPREEKMPFKSGVSSVYALQVSNGDLIWHYTMNNGKDSWVTLFSVVNEVVYTGTNAVDSGKSYISALQGSDGTLLWRYTTVGTPTGALVANRVIYIGSDSGTLYALRANNGSVLWRNLVIGFVFNTPILVGGSVYVGAASGIVYALQATTGSLRWSYHTKVS